MFKPGQTIICVDENDSSRKLCGWNHKNLLQHLKQYIVEDYSDCFVKLEGVKGEWYETRFIAVEELV